MAKNGISDENLNKLFTHAQINLRDQDMIRNLGYLGTNVVTDVRIDFHMFKISFHSIVAKYNER